MNKREAAEFNASNIVEFRANGGKLSSFGDAPVLLLTTVGAKSGESRTSPMMYRADEQDPDRVYVFASAAGAEKNPAWFNNLVAHPTDVELEIGTEKLSARAEVLPESTRARIFALQADDFSGFAAYQEKTSRRIPVVALNLRRSSGRGSA